MVLTNKYFKKNFKDIFHGFLFISFQKWSEQLRHTTSILCGNLKLENKEIEYEKKRGQTFTRKAH